MAITSVTEMWSRRTGFKASKDGQSFTGGFASSYQVVHDPGESIGSIINASGLPQLGDALPGYPDIFCTQVGNVETVGPIMSIVPVTYEGELGGNDESNPLNKPPEIDYGSVSVTEEIDTDINGFPLTNVNGDPVYGIQDEIWDWELNVQRNFESFNGPVLHEYSRSYNSDTFFGWAPGTASLRSIRVKPVFYGPDQQNVYYQVSAKVGFRFPYNTTNERAWWKRYRNEGFRIRAGATCLFSGGGGTEAAAYPVISSGGVSAVVVTNRGKDYTSAPSITFETGISGGSGATATANIANGQVVSVTVTNAGTGYTENLVQALDDHEEPVTSPVLLDRRGRRESNAANAVWIERPTKRPLPYSALGLLD